MSRKILSSLAISALLASLGVPALADDDGDNARISIRGRQVVWTEPAKEPAHALVGSPSTQQDEQAPRPGVRGRAGYAHH